MTLTLLTTLIGFVAAALYARAVGGSAGTGVVAGFLLGAGVTGALVAWQRSVLRTAPARALNTLVLGFLVKLGVVVAVALAFVVSSALREAAHPAAFLLAFGGAALCVLLPGTFENARVLRERRAPGSAR